METATNGQITELQQHLVGDLRRLMQQKSLRQGQLAHHCGISPGSMSDLMHEKRPFSGPLLGKLSRVLGDFMATEDHLFRSLRQYQKMLHIAAATREQALFSLACGNTGIGKTTSMRQLFASEPMTFYLKVEDDLSWRQLLRKIAAAVGVTEIPYYTDAMREALQARVELLASDRPLLIIDEAEELSNSVARKLKRLHRLTEGQLGAFLDKKQTFSSKLHEHQKTFCLA